LLAERHVVALEGCVEFIELFGLAFFDCELPLQFFLEDHHLLL
jgi:hypothetical protein